MGKQVYMEIYIFSYLEVFVGGSLSHTPKGLHGDSQTVVFLLGKLKYVFQAHPILLT